MTPDKNAPAGSGRGRQSLLLAWELMALILPLLFTCTQPPLVSAGLIALLLFCMGMAAIHARMDLLPHFVVPTISAMLGLSFTLGSLLSGVWGFFIGVFGFFLGLSLLLIWDARLAFGQAHALPAGYSTLAQHAQAVGLFRGQPVEALAYEHCLPGSGDEFPGRSTQLIFSAIPLPSTDRWSMQPGSHTHGVAAAEAQAFHEQTGLGGLAANGQLAFPAPAGTHALHGEPVPVESALPSCYSLWLDNAPTGLILEAGWPVVWREDGKALLCRACPESQIGSYAYWLWQVDSGWSLVADPWQGLSAEPLLDFGHPSRLDTQGVWRTATLRPVMTEHADYGYSLVESRELADAVSIRLCTSLSGKGRQATTFYLEPMQNQTEPCMTWLRDSADGRYGAFTCRIGSWLLEGEWCLDHRVSECGRYLALIQFAEAPLVPHRLVIADVLAKRLMLLEEVLVSPRLLAFREGRIELVRVLGRLSETKSSTPLLRFDEGVPKVDQTERFVSSRLTGRLYYERAQIAVDSYSVRLLPRWRLATNSVSAGDNFVLPAPSGRDAAWMFGAGHASDEPFPSHTGACLLTASGCALAGLAPPMAWSEDGRYLALTRLRRTGESSSEAQDCWSLLLLDVEERTLRQTNSQFEVAPCLDAFDCNGLHIRLMEDVSVLSLQDLLSSSMQMLIRSGLFWFTADEISNAASWGHVDAGHLAYWRRGPLG